MKQKAAGILTVGVALTGMLASAETVAWYHFDEAPAGTRTTADSVISNAVDATVGAGKAHVWHKNGYNRPTINEMPEELMPEYATSFEDNVVVADRSSGTIIPSRSALRFCSADAASASADASTLYLENGTAFHNQSFTIEFMIRLTCPRSTSWRTILRMGPPSTKFTTSMPFYFYFYLDAYGRFNFSLSTDTTTNSVQNASTDRDDGKWHHVAAVVDGANHKYRLYVDGNASADQSFEGSIAYSGTTPMTIGGTPDSYYGTWKGCFDELRISNTALSKEQLLSFTVARPPVSKLTDSNTLFHTSFVGSLNDVTTTNSYSGKTLAYISAFVNDAVVRADYPIDALVRAWCGGTVVPDSSEIVSDVKYPRISPEKSSTCAIDNESSYRTISPEVASYPPALLLQDNYAVLKDSFTIEFFGKMATGVASSGPANSYCYILMQNSALQFYTTGTGMLGLVTSAGGVTMPSIACNDGKWHHYALVYDKREPAGNSTFDLYIDYEPVAHQDGTWFDTTKSSNNSMVFFGYYSNYVYGPRDFKFDELRITRGALGVDQFIHKEQLGMMLIVR